MGTGKNLPYYPLDVDVTAIDFSPRMLSYAKKSAFKLGIDVKLLFDAMNPIALRIMGANINRRTIDNIQKVGWKITKDVNLGNNIVHLIEATP